MMASTEAAAQSMFDQWAGAYDHGRLASWFRYTQDLALDELGLRPDSRVLDVGCGTGYAAVAAGAQCSTGLACGIDISGGMLREARRNRPEQLSDRVSFHQAEAQALPFPEATFDRLLCTNSFHHYSRPHRALAEMHRVLEPGGRLVVLDNAPDGFWYTWLWDRVLRILERGHVRYYKSSQLGEMIAESGFTDVRCEFLRREFLKHGKLAACLQLWSAKRPGVGG